MRLDESTRDGGEVNATSAVKRRKVPAKRAAAVSIAGEGANGGVGVAGGVGASAEAREDRLRESLKRKYASSILSLKDEFLKKRKKGKLPAVATDALKEWWRERLVWPYPTEADKATLGRRTGLNPTQINNWFINQRKRHWHKLFPGAQPATAEEILRGARPAFRVLTSRARHRAARVNSNETVADQRRVRYDGTARERRTRAFEKKKQSANHESDATRSRTSPTAVLSPSMKKMSMNTTDVRSLLEVQNSPRRVRRFVPHSSSLGHFSP